MTEALASAAQVVAAYSVQLAAVVVTGLALCGLLRLRAPRVHLAVAQALLVLALALPWLQPPRRGGGPSGHVTVTAVAWGLAPGPAAGTLPAVALAGIAAAQAFPLEGPPDAQASAAVAAPAEGAVGAAGAAGKKVGERTRTVMVEPTYPAEAKKKGVEGSVVLDVLITAAGDVKDVKVTSGPAELADSAASAVRQWKFAPGPHDTRATLTVRYVLAKKEQGARLDVRHLARDEGGRRP